MCGHLPIAIDPRGVSVPILPHNSLFPLPPAANHHCASFPPHDVTSLIPTFPVVHAAKLPGHRQDTHAGQSCP